MLLQDAVFRPGGGKAAGLDIGHVLVTRYNQRNDQYPATYEAVADAAGYRRYLASRFPQFRDVCLPSILGQQRRPDRWLIAFDGEDRGAVADVVDLVAGHDWIEPLWQAPGEHWRDAITRGIAPSAERHDVLAESRCDNDDALAVTNLAFVDRYARAVAAGRDGALDFWLVFPNGAQLHEGRYYQFVRTLPHFLSRVTRGDPASGTVFEVQHTHLFDDATREVHTPLTRKPQWLQNVHGSNLTNSQLAGAFELGPPARVAALFGR